MALSGQDKQMKKFVCLSIMGMKTEMVSGGELMGGEIANQSRIIWLFQNKKRQIAWRFCFLWFVKIFCRHQFL